MKTLSVLLASIQKIALPLMALSALGSFTTSAHATSFNSTTLKLHTTLTESVVVYGTTDLRHGSGNSYVDGPFEQTINYDGRLGESLTIEFTNDRFDENLYSLDNFDSKSQNADFSDSIISSDILTTRYYLWSDPWLTNGNLGISVFDDAPHTFPNQLFFTLSLEEGTGRLEAWKSGFSYFAQAEELEKHLDFDDSRLSADPDLSFAWYYKIVADIHAYEVVGTNIRAGDFSTVKVNTSMATLPAFASILLGFLFIKLRRKSR
ncbi:hypothetical protein MLD52_05850 [Puniceicoccaceae bacterium K14]|nr:hypothetical protein [Puniceicoccaceae bacterium K14]